MRAIGGREFTRIIERRGWQLLRINLPLPGGDCCETRPVASFCIPESVRIPLGPWLRGLFEDLRLRAHAVDRLRADMVSTSMRRRLKQMASRVS